MDNFMDKLAQKFNAQEMIKANSQAEAAEMKKLQLQVAEYEKILQEMRKLNYKNAELSEKIDVLVGENAGKLQGLQEDEQKLLSTLRDLTEEQTRNREEELSRKAEEKQDVQQDTKAQTKDIIAQTQVYRNVQAVIIEELKKQTDALCQENTRLASRMNVVMAFSLITMLVAVASLILQILTGLNIKLF